MKEKESTKVKGLYQKEELLCPQCGKAIGKSTSFCSRCGTNLKFWPDKQGRVESKKESMLCPRCQRPLEQGVRFCSKCGTNF